MPIIHYPQTRLRPQDRPANGPPAEQVATIYNRAGRDYIAYADGDPARLFSFDGLHGYADRQIWLMLESKLAALRASGAESIRLLDAGCGPGTWLHRLVVRALDLGFTSVTARGFDIAQVQIRQARMLAKDLCGVPGVDLRFDVADLTERLAEQDGSVDMTLCLYSVLSHLPVANLADVLREFARVTSGHLVTAVRSVGSTPSAFVCPVEKVRYLQLDNERDECEIELLDGLRSTFPLHLFTASELRGRFVPHFDIEDLRGLDLFHTRFASDPRWNPCRSRIDARLSGVLARLEETYANEPELIDHATHIVLVARSRAAPRFRTVSRAKMPKP